MAIDELHLDGKYKWWDIFGSPRAAAVVGSGEADHRVVRRVSGGCMGC